MNDNDTKEWPIERFLQWVAEIVRKDDRAQIFRAASCAHGTAVSAVYPFGNTPLWHTLYN